MNRNRSKRPLKRKVHFMRNARWTKQEEQLLLSLKAKNVRDVVIADRLNRTLNAVKNRFYVLKAKVEA